MSVPPESAVRRLNVVSGHLLVRDDGAAAKLMNAERVRSANVVDVQALSVYLFGSVTALRLYETVVASIGDDSALVDERRHNRTLAEQRRVTMEQIAHVADMIRANAEANVGAEHSDGIDDTTDNSRSRAGVSRSFEDVFFSVMSLLDGSWSIRIGVHFGLFASAVAGQCSLDQRAVYEPRIRSLRMFGCFAMSEIGHGSNVRDIETTATFSAAADEFILNTPTLTATKWWIGGAAHTATHAAVFARLLLNGADYGVHCFIVPLRAVDSGIPFDGVVIGDMNSKMGRNGLDNGWIQFHQYRLARSGLCNRWANVDRNGVYSAAPHRAVTFTALIATRVELFTLCADTLKRALTIAIRYATVRRQGKHADEERERQLIDYPTHRHRLFPVLANAFAFHFTAKRIAALCERALAAVDDGDMSLLSFIHATSSGLKAVGTSYVNDALETCRLCLGGMGYSSFSELPAIKADWAVMAQWEGSNEPLMIQCAKHVIKQTPTKRTSSRFDARELTSLQSALERRCECVTERLRADLSASALSYDAWIIARSVKCISAAKLHCQAFAFACLVSAADAAPLECRETVILLARINGLSLIHDALSDFQVDGVLTADECASVEREFACAVDAMRDRCLAVVDAFALPDFLLGPLGRYDGDVYTRMFQCIRSAPSDAPTAEYYADVIRPLFTQ